MLDGAGRPVLAGTVPSMLAPLAIVPATPRSRARSRSKTPTPSRRSSLPAVPERQSLQPPELQTPLPKTAAPESQTSFPKTAAPDSQTPLPQLPLPQRPEPITSGRSRQVSVESSGQQKSSAGTAQLQEALARLMDQPAPQSPRGVKRPSSTASLAREPSSSAPTSTTSCRCCGT